MMRIGLGFDLHRLEEGRPCILGGVELPHPSGPAGHSDGDAVLHALVDAVTGAAGLDDVGTLFPDDDERWKGADSALAAPLVLDLVRLLDRADQAGLSGLQTGLACFFKTPLGVDEYSFPEQMALLEDYAAELRQAAPERG